MRLTKGQLKRIIREEYSQLKRKGLITESSIIDDLGAEAAAEAYDDGIRKIGDFVEWFQANYPSAASGLSRRALQSELAVWWRLEKKARRHINRYDNWSPLN